MIAYTTLALFLIALFGSLNVNIKIDRLFFGLVFLLFCAVLARFGIDFINGKESVFSLLWNSSPGGDIKIDIISNSYNYNFILPFFIITFMALAQNLIFRYEERRSAYGATLIFNLAALMTMITGNNFVQLLCALFIVDILSLFLIHDMEAYKRYILLNISADMIIFAIMAIINCKVDSLDIREILRYKQIGHHLDFMALAGLSAVFMKMGLFLFHIGIIGLHKIRLHRLQNVLFLTSPVCGLILLLKFHVLWNGSSYFAPYLHFICILSFIGGFVMSMCAEQLKLKFIYWQMMFWAILTELLCFKGFEWTINASKIVLQMYALSVALYILYYYTGRQNSLLSLKQQKQTNQSALGMAFVLIFIMFAAISGNLTEMYNRGNRYYIWLFAILYTLSLAAAIRQILFVPKQLLAPNNPKIRIHITIFILCGLLEIGVLDSYKLVNLPVLGFSSVFLILSCLLPLKISNTIYGWRWPQKDNVFISNLYKYMLIKPLRYSGRFLWLLVDHLLIEKAFINLSQTLVQKSLLRFKNIHRSASVGGPVIVLIVIALICCCYVYGRNS